MSTTIRIPRAHRKRLKAFDSLPDVNRWGGDIDARIVEILQSLGDTQRAIKEITRTTGAASIGLHAANHRPATGIDPLATAAPTSILGGTSSNSTGVGNSFSRNDHSHDVATATPTIGYSASAGAEGSGNALLRADATLLAPTFLRSAFSDSTITLTDDGTAQTFTASLGILNIVPGSGININFPASTAATLILKPDATTAAGITMAIQGRPLAGSRSLLSPNWFSASASDVFTSQTFRCWDTQFSSFTAGQITSCEYVGYDGSLFTISPSASSGADNKAYFLRSAGVVIGNANGTWAEVATASLRGPRRVISSYKTDLVACLILEAPTGANKKQDGTTDLDQVTLYLKQQTAQGTAPTNKIGLVIDAQNAGTNRYSIKALTDYAWLGGTLFDDNAKGKYGTGRDAEIYYDGTDFVCDPDVVGSGSFDIRGALKCDAVTNDTGLAAGVYTPTRSAETNLDSNVTMSEAQYLRVGNTVTVSGRFTADPTLTATATSFEITLPIASNIGAAEDVAGTAFCGSIAGQGAEIIGVAANDTAKVQWVAGDITSQTWAFVFSYQVI